MLPQVEHHYLWLSKAIDELTVEQACFELAAGRPSIAWLVGHLTAGADSLAQAVAGLDAACGVDFLARHGSPHWEVTGEVEWEALREEWKRTAARSQQGLVALPESDFEFPPAIEILPEFAQRLTTRHAFLTGEIFHFAYHLGQIGSLRAAQDLGWA